MSENEQPINFHEELLVQLQPRLYGYIIGLLANPSDAKDVLQETNRNVLAKINEFQNTGSFSAWVYKFAYYQCLAFRKKSQRNKLNFEADLLDQLAEVSQYDEGVADQKLSLLSLCLSKLQPKTRAIVAAYYYKNQPVKSIAEERDLQANHVAQILFRARKALYDCIQKEAIQSI